MALKVSHKTGIFTIDNEIYCSALCKVYRDSNGEYWLKYNTKPKRIIPFGGDHDSAISKAIEISREDQEPAGNSGQYPDNSPKNQNSYKQKTRFLPKSL